MSNILRQEANVYIDDKDAGTVNFLYPGIYNDSSILSAIRLEIGALAAWTPSTTESIQPYITDYFPHIFTKPSTKILVTTAERTFFEKATILHQEALRPNNSTIPARYSRHYYDMYCMIHSLIKDSALKKPELLDEVSLFKKTFYPRGWARYDLAKFGSLKLLPAEHSIPVLRKDYEIMHSMIFGNYPTFDEILSSLNQLQIEMNS